MARRVAAAVASARQAATAADAGLAQTGPAVVAVTGGGVPAASDTGTLQLQVRRLLACSYGKAKLLLLPHVKLLAGCGTCLNCGRAGAK